MIALPVQPPHLFVVPPLLLQVEIFEGRVPPILPVRFLGRVARGIGALRTKQTGTFRLNSGSGSDLQEDALSAAGKRAAKLNNMWGSAAVLCSPRGNAS